MSNRVRELRESRKIELSEFAELVGVSTRYLIALEEDACVATVETALRIARTLGATVERVFGGEEPEPESSCSTAPEPVLSERAVVSDVAPQAESGPEENRKRKRGKKGVAESHKRKPRVPKEESGPEPAKIAPYATAWSSKSLDELMAGREEKTGSLFEESETRDSIVLRRVYAPDRSQKVSSASSKTATEEGLAATPSSLVDPTRGRAVRYFDLFCGIGGFRYAAQNTLAEMNRDGECVLSCDIDEPARESYAANFGETPYGDVTTLQSENIPDFDLLFAGFPCQTFSIIGLRKGFADETKGSLFFQIARILKDKRPRAFVLENVRQLTTHDSGRTFEIILRVLQEELGYCVDWRVLNALECGVPQKRERVVIVGALEPFEMEWPAPVKNGKSLADVLENDADVDKRYFASPEIVRRRKEAHSSEFYPSIWHENKSGNISSYPYSCALRAGASYNYLLVNGERRLTPREMLRLQGFPDDFKIAVSDFQIRKQAGNAAPVCLIQRALERFLPLIFEKNERD